MPLPQVEINKKDPSRKGSRGIGSFCCIVHTIIYINLNKGGGAGVCMVCMYYVCISVMYSTYVCVQYTYSVRAKGKAKKTSLIRHQSVI